MRGIFLLLRCSLLFATAAGLGETSKESPNTAEHIPVHLACPLPMQAASFGLPAAAIAARRRSLTADGGEDASGASSKGRGSSKGGKGGKTPPPPSPCPSVWSEVKQADDLKFLVR